MSDIVIIVTGIGPDDTGDGILYSGVCRCSGMTSADPSINWWLNLDAGTLAASVNSGIKTAAVNAATAAGQTIGMLDKKTLVGAAVGV